MRKRIWRKLMRILVTFAMLCVAVGGALIPGVAYGQGTWSIMTSPTSATLYGVWGSSASDVFAVGDGGKILHYNGSGWELMPSSTTANLRGVWGSAGNDVFAVGDGAILHYNGSAWSTMSGGYGSTLYGIWGSSGSDVFAVGAGSSTATILHYNGSSWSAMDSHVPTPFFPLSPTPSLWAVWGSGPNDVFAVGGGIIDYTGIEKRVIQHYNGSTWSTMIDNNGVYTYLRGIWGSSATNVWAVGDYDTTIYEHGIMQYYDGNEWRLYETIFELPPYSLLSVWGSSASDVFAVGVAGTIIHESGGGFYEMTGATYANLYGVWGSSTTDVFAVGESGCILRYNVAGPVPAVPELPTIVLLGIGLAGLAGWFAVRRRRSIPQ